MPKKNDQLRKIIKLGKQLDVNVKKYEEELHKNKISSLFDKALNKKESTKNTSTKKIAVDPVEKIKPIQKIPKKLSYEITSVYTQDNQIILNFERNVTRSDVKFFELHYTNIHKDIYDIVGNFKDARPTKLKINGVDRIYISQYKPNVLRINFSHKKNLKTTFSVVENQMVITVHGIKNEKVDLQTALYQFRQTKTIVLDAGHGGKDPGAVGYRKIREKDIVLSVNNALSAELKKRGYKVYRTRYKDSFASLKSRTKYANKKDADIFLSIHCNAAPKSKARKAKGIETYFLSPARSERAKRVAALENKFEMKKMDNSSKNMFLMMTNQSKITASHKLSIDIHRNMLYNVKQKYNDVSDHGVREGPFWVLVGAQMPSVLIELGYITHPVEARRLNSKSYQRLLVRGIANGIDEYFRNNP